MEQDGLPDSTSEASRMGTCLHQVCAEVLEHGRDPQGYLDRTMCFAGRDEWWLGESDATPEFTVTIDQDMVDAVVTGTDYVKQRVRLTGGMLEVEQRVPIGHFTGEDGAGGTSDVVLMYGDTIEVDDFKFGRHKVEAYDVIEPARGATPPRLRINLQLACYALGAYEKFKLLFNFRQVKVVIVQPFLNHVSEYSCSIEELMEVQEFLRIKAAETRLLPEYRPSGENCHFCKAKTRCHARNRAVIEAACAGFEDAIDRATPAPVQMFKLGSLYGLVPMIQQWCRDISDRVYDELQAGRPVVREDGLRYVLVPGRKGDRKWDDTAKAEEELKQMRLRKDQMYSMKLISPSAAEKLAKQRRNGPPPVLNGKQWERLQELIVQDEGSPSVALETDSRPALPNAADGFEDVPTAG